MTPQLTTRLASSAVLLALAAAPAASQVPAADSAAEFKLVASWTPARTSTVAPLRRAIALNLRGASVKQALREIGRLSGIHIAYGDDVLHSDARVSVHADGMTVQEALGAVLEGTGLDAFVSLSGKAVLVRAIALGDSTQVGTVTGRVTDAKTAKPVPNASVYLEGTRWRTTTNEAGQYRLVEVTAGTYVLTASRIGYAKQSQSVTVAAGQEVTVDVILQAVATELEQVVVTGTLVPTQVKALPTPVSVITAASIEDRQPRSITDIFRQAVPSAVAWDLSSSSPAQTTMSVRGATSLSGGQGQLKVYLDGVEISNELFAVVDPSSVGRIEVIRGPQAATIYGSDAIGGVMQVFTKHGDSTLARPRATVSTALGVVESPYAGYSGALRQDYKVGVTGGAPTATYNLGFGYTHTGDWAPEVASSLPSVYGSAHLVRGSLDLDISGRYYVQSYSAAGYNPLLAQTGFPYYSKPFYLVQQGKEETYGARLTYTPTAWWSHAVTIGIDRFDNGYHNTQPRLTTSSDTLVSVDQFTQSKASVAYHTSLLFHPWRDISANVIAGVDHYTFDYSGFFNFAAPTATNSISGATGYQSVITNTGYFTQARLSMWDVLFLTGGLRAEQNSTVGSELGPPVSPRAGLSLVRPIGAGTVKFRGSYGEATRPPAPFLRDGSVSPFAVTLANPFLAPERQKGWDAGVDLVFGAKGSLSATYYHQTAEDLIQFVLVDATSKPVTYQNQNVGRAKNTGVELEGTLFSEVAQLRAQYAYTRSRVDALGPNYTGNLQVGDQVLLVPKQTAGAALTVAPLRGTNLTAGVTYVGKWTNYDFLGLYACFGGTGPCQQSLRGYQIQYPGFAKVNVQISQRITSIVSAFLSVDNLTNNDAYEYANSMTALGRTTMLGVRAQY